MRVADWIAEYLHSIGVTKVHGIMGGGAAGLNDGFIKNGKLDYICYHHEQGAGHAAIGESKYTGKLAVVNPTTGCAGTNCATSVLNAWQDGVPILFLSGNVKLDNCSQWLYDTRGIKVRHYGAQEHNIVGTMKSITKFSQFIKTPDLVPYFIQKAVHIATTGRPGPVWIDIPGNIQTAEVSNTEEKHFFTYTADFQQVDILTNKLASAERPLVVAGQGIRQAGCIDKFIDFVTKHKLPFVTTYGAQDYAPYNHYLNFGAVGIRGNRAANFAMQNADLLLFLGTSLGSTVVGYDPAQFNPSSYKIYVDIEQDELNKNIIPIDWKIEANIKQLLKDMI